MFENLKSNVAIGLLAITPLPIAAGCLSEARKVGRELREAAVVEAEADRRIGQCDGFDFYIRKVGEKNFIIASRLSGVAMIEHTPTDTDLDEKHSFSLKPLGKVGRHNLSELNIDGVDYLFASSYSSAEIRLIGAAPDIENKK